VWVDCEEEEEEEEEVPTGWQKKPPICLWVSFLGALDHQKLKKKSFHG